MKQPTHTKAYGPVINRLSDVMMHCTRYGFRCTARLAEDAGVQPATLSRLLSGQNRNPSFRIIARLTAALENQLDVEIDPRNLAAEQGLFPLQYCCSALGCRGCMPYAAHDEDDNLRPEFKDVGQGMWVMSQHPHGVPQEEA